MIREAGKVNSGQIIDGVARIHVLTANGYLIEFGITSDIGAVMDEYETMLRTAPTTEDGGDFVLFEGRDQFVGQFKTAEEGAAYIREHKMNRPTLLRLSMLQRRSYAYLDGVLYEW